MVAIFTNVGIMIPNITTSKRPTSYCTCFSSVTSLCLSTPASRMKITKPSLNHESANISGNFSSSNGNPIRRSGNYEPTMWDFQFIQSIGNDYVGEKYMKRFTELKAEIKKNLIMMMVKGSSDELEKLELIDNLQRLGVSYHFKYEIMQILRTIHQSGAATGDSLHSTALKFRLLREHGFDISQETEFTLKNATTFTVAHLKNYVDNHPGDQVDIMVALVLHALELPKHWTMPRLETEWYISIYERMSNANPLLLELSKLDFNIVQAAHQEDLRTLSKWWKSTSLAEKLSFSRDRLVENFLWSVGLVFEPQHNYCRRMLKKVVAFIVVTDDIYDVYGTLNELEIFTDAVERWDIKAMERLPDYMKLCYLALFNSTNEMAYDILKEQGINVLPYLTKQWADLCKAYLREARWYYNEHMPTLQEYMDNAWISIATPLVLVHAFIFVTSSITKEALESLNNYPDIIRRCATINRYVDDLGTSSEELKRGDVSKSIQCYMNEKGASEEEARKHIKFLIKETWELMNKDQREELLFSEEFIGIVLNFSRASHCIYQHGDGHGIQNSHITNRISKLLFEPITI